MTWLNNLELSSAWILVPLLLAVIAFDLRFMKIPNVLVILFVVAFVAIVPASVPLDALVWRVVIAMGVLFVGIFAFAIGLMGGGDAKVLAALTLLIPTPLLAQFALILAVCLVLGIVALMIARTSLANVSTGWKSLKDRRYPMGLSIGTAGIALMFIGPIV